MVLPSIKCSSCGDPIPLSAMGDHICRPPSRSAKSSKSGSSSRYQSHNPPVQSPKPSYPHQSYSSRNQRSDRERDDRGPVRPAFGGPSSSNGGLQIPSASPSAASSSRLSPHSASSNSRSPSPHTPSPTNPFFPAQAAALQSDPGLSVFGLGFNGVGVRPEGPFPNDRPLPAGVSDLSSMNTGGDSRPPVAGGMAGVGCRAFQAAAWSVTASVAMASAGSRSKTPDQGHRPINPPRSVNPPPMPIQPRSAGPEQSSRPPWQQEQIQPPPRSGSHSHTMPTQQRHRGGTDPRPGQHSDFHPSTLNDVPPRAASAMDRRHHPTPQSPPLRTSSAQPNRSIDQNHGFHRQPVPRHQHSGSTSSQTSIGSPVVRPNPSRSRTDDTTPRSASKPAANGAFFERYKRMQNSASSTNNTSRKLGLGVKNSGVDDFGSRPPKIVDSPEQSVYDLADAYDDMDGDSALPWATPALEDSPEITQLDKLPRIRTNPSSKLQHQRHHTDDSEASSNSSSGSGRYGLTSGPESEEVVTPSTSFEGLSERMQNVPLSKSKKDRYGYDLPTERKAPLAPVRKGSSDPADRDRHRDHRVPNSTSDRTITGKDRSRTLPEPSPSVTSSRSRSTPKTCQKCGETVGGLRKFVERDGVVLCEADWKKMYLPSCRKCHQLIETKMVSADDGQLKGKWHASCFTCSRCDKPFEGKDFYVHAGRPWCQYHYAKET